MRLLQVCNVGDICGGTAACAWTITRALPRCRHSVWFLSHPTAETQTAFADCQVKRIDRLTESDVRAAGADLVLLHNTAASRVETITSAPVAVYHHSTGSHPTGEYSWACSRWLAEKMPGCGAVLYQPVPLPPAPAGILRPRGRYGCDLVIGRINTPVARKWPADLIPFYAGLAARIPAATWEFVGAPPAMQNALATACRGRAVFHPAGWQARQHLGRWDVLLYHHPSLMESFGRTVAEAQRAGCVPVVDNQGGFVEQIESGTTGWLCDSEDNFAAALELLRDPVIRWRVAERGREAADDRCSLRRFAERFGTAVLDRAPVRGQ